MKNLMERFVHPIEDRTESFDDPYSVQEERRIVISGMYGTG